MRIYEEKQVFNRLWIFIFGTISFLGWLYLLYLQMEEGKDLPDLIPWTITGIFLFLLFIFFYNIKLLTRIDAKGVYAQFSPPGFFKKFYPWSMIKKIHVRKYAPIAEYGGWGVRGLGRAKAYNVRGNNGIQIVTLDKKSFLIGTQQPDKVRQVLVNYKQKNTIKD